MRLFANANYDFLGQRRIAYGISIGFIVIGLLVMLIRGVNYSVEFTGGTLVQVQTTKPADVATLRNALQARGIANAEIQTFGSDREIAVRARVARAGSDANDTQATADAVGEALDATLGAGNYQILRTEAVGPKVGGELRQQAVLAILMSFLAVLAYLAYRFEWRFGVAAVVATGHDIIAAIAFIGLARLEVSLFVVAGLLTIVGNAPYAVTKHAAVALAEWLAITYGDQGIRVSCLCPEGVKTDMLPDDAWLAAGALEPEEVAQTVVEGLADERFLILPHPRVAEYLRQKATDYDRWLRGMRRLQAEVSR